MSRIPPHGARIVGTWTTRRPEPQRRLRVPRVSVAARAQWALHQLFHRTELEASTRVAQACGVTPSSGPATAHRPA